METTDFDFKKEFEQFDQVFWVIKLPEFQWEYISSAVEKLRGYTVEEGMEQSLDQILLPESYKLIAEKIEKELYQPPSDNDHQVLELEHYCKNGSTCWLEVELRVKRNAEGWPTEIIGISRDIDQTKKIIQIQQGIIKQMKEVIESRALIPICANCKKIKRVDGSWQQAESYLSAHFPIDFSHGICPECMKKLYPEFVKEDS